MSLSNLMKTGLPLNRKERYFTGTVSPMIVSRVTFGWNEMSTEEERMLLPEYL
ncbi:MAG: hypothetical protein GX113_05105 [Actinobacteria bacterium]|jgi:hypothetical protein|nr:hypothetical protein [Actinomycetota bacterium]